MFSYKQSSDNAPRAHIETKNRSFLLTYHELKKLNIENNMFFLALYDNSLIHVDPHAENLSAETKARILIEIKRNPWYFYREVCRIRLEGQPKGGRFGLHRANLAELWCLHNNISAILTISRQNWKTISACSFYEYLFLFGTSSSEFLIMNKKLMDAKKNLKRIKDMIDLLPAWLVPTFDNDRNSIMSCYKGGDIMNTLTVVPSGKDEDHADGLGRGMTSPLHWHDEHAFEKYNKVKWMASGPAYSQSSLNAKESGKFYSRLITTTPNNTDVPEGAFTRSIINGAADFKELFYDWRMEEVYNYIRKNSDNDFVFISYTWRQLRRNQAWYEDQCRLLQHDRKSIRREIECEWTSSSDLSPFSEEEIEELEYNERSPLSEELYYQDSYLVKFYQPINLEAEYMITCDVGGGLGRDSTVFILNDPDTLDTIATIGSSKMDLEDAKAVAKNLLDDLPLAFLVIERNSYGLAVVQHLIKNEKYKRRLFYTEKKDERTLIGGNGRSKITQRIHGIDTTATTRKLIIESLYIMVREEPSVIASPDIIKQIKTLINNKGKIEHAPGEHDDYVMAKAFAKYVMTYYGHIVRRFRLELRANQNSAFNKISRLNNRTYMQTLLTDEDDLVVKPKKVYSAAHDLMDYGLTDKIRRIQGATPQQRNFDLVSALNARSTTLQPTPAMEQRTISALTYLCPPEQEPSE